MRALAGCAVILMALMLGRQGFQARAQDKGATSELGMWLSEGRDGIFHIEKCVGGTLCGALVGMDYDKDVPKDVWGRSECGLMMLTDFRPVEGGKWGGHILDPRTGRVYQARIWLDGPNILKLRGFVLGMPFLGQTQTWTRYSGGAIGAQCKMPHQSGAH